MTDSTVFVNAIEAGGSTPRTVRVLTTAGINSTIADAVTAGETAIQLVKGNYNIGSGTTVSFPADMTAYIEAGAKFTGTGTLIFNGHINAPINQTVFATTLTVRTSNFTNPVLHPEWWGGRPLSNPRITTLGSNVDSTVAFQKLNAAPMAPYGYDTPGSEYHRRGSCSMKGIYAVTDEIRLDNVSINMASPHTGYQGAGFRFFGTPNPAKSILRVKGADFLTTGNLSLTSATKATTDAGRLYAALCLHTDEGGVTQRQHTHTNLTIGDPVGTFDNATPGYMFKYGIVSDGSNANNDFMGVHNANIGECETAICNKFNQNVHWTFDTVQFRKCDWVYESTTGGGQITWNNSFANDSIKKGFMNVLGDQNTLWEGEFVNVGFEHCEGEYFIKSASRCNIIIRNATFSFARNDSEAPAPKLISVLGYHSSVQFIGGQYYGITGSNPLGHLLEIETTDNFFTPTHIALTGRFAGLENGIRLKRTSSQSYQQIRLTLEPKILGSVYPADRMRYTITPTDSNWTGSNPYYINLSTLIATAQFETFARKVLFGEPGKSLLYTQTLRTNKSTTPASGTHTMTFTGFLPAKTAIKGVTASGFQSLFAGDGVASVGDYVIVGTAATPEQWGRVEDVNARMSNSKPLASAYFDVATDLILKRFRGRGVNRVFTQSGNTVTGNADFFHSTDVGRTIEWLTGPQAGTTATISAVSGNTATVSNSTTQATSEQLRIRMDFVVSRQIILTLLTETMEGIEKIMPDHYDALTALTAS